MTDLAREFGEIDIYLFDQLLRGRFVPGMRVLDAGCGNGRNLVYLLRTGYDVCAVDEDPAAIEAVRGLAAQLAPGLPEDSFRTEPVEAMTFPDRHADVVVCSAVLHFARDDAHFRAMLESCWRVLLPGGCSSRGWLPPRISRGDSGPWAAGGSFFPTARPAIWWTSPCWPKRPRPSARSRPIP